MRKVDPVRHEDKRREVLDAAVRCFIRRGFHGTAISHICTEAGMSAGHLYHYFPSKEAIVEAMVVANLKHAARRFAETAPEESSVLDVIVAQLDHSASDDSRRTPLLFDMLAEAGRNPAIAKILGEHSRGMQTLLVDILRRGQARGEVDPSLDPVVVAPVLIGLVDGSKSLALRNLRRASAPPGDILRMLISRFLSPPAK